MVDKVIDQTSTVVSPYDTGNHSEPILPNICRAGFGEQGPPVLLDNLTPSARELFLSVYGSDNFTLADTCAGDDYKNERRIQSKHTTIVLSMFFISLLGVGMGQTAVYTLGIPYIDDNVASRESPLYFAITIGVRILGPALGFILGSVCTRLYADLSVDPQITPTDPRWVGAWWLGLVMVSALLMLASLAMFSFPKRLRSSRPTPRALQRGKKNPSLRDLSSHIQEILEEFNTRFKETETLKSSVQLYMNPIGATIKEQEPHLQLELCDLQADTAQVTWKSWSLRGTNNHTPAHESNSSCRKCSGGHFHGASNLARQHPVLEGDVTHHRIVWEHLHFTQAIFHCERKGDIQRPNQSSGVVVPELKVEGMKQQLSKLWERDKVENMSLVDLGKCSPKELEIPMIERKLNLLLQRVRESKAPSLS
uniref:Uncharacterized protein n=1 Tax=Timema genevievae TaxID=629358 RepID=A0A7R9JXL3_TIMGE|nr:unnamed protein product [Timema genevievae]